MNKKFRALLIVLLALIAVPMVLYFGGKWALYLYADYWAVKLIKLDQKGLLSTQFGAAWQEVVYGETYRSVLSGKSTTPSPVVEGVLVAEYPSISVVEKLNRIDRYSSRITIEDRFGREIASIRTDHQRVAYKSFPQTLVKSVVASEDRHFFTNNRGFEFDSFVRATVIAWVESIRSGEKKLPRGTSSITQQVGKMFISQLDNEGNRHVSRTIDRKIRELQIAAALRKRHRPEEIMEIYLNHCLTSSHGLIGAEEISRGLWGKSVTTLSDAESVYLSRMVKWGANLPDRIKKQCAIDMDRIQKANGWSDQHRDAVLEEIFELTFRKPEPIATEHPHLVDLANRCWLDFLERQGFDESRRRALNLLDPSSLIRKKGNLTLRLTIDVELQNFLAEQVSKRGYGDSLMVTDIRIGSSADTLTGKMPKRWGDLWNTRVITTRTLFSDPGSSFATALLPGDTLYWTVEYDRAGLPANQYRAVERYYRRGTIRTEQQYGYASLDGVSGKLLAYVSRDKLGSGSVSLFAKPFANGTATLAPIVAALLFDLGEFTPTARWDDRMPVSDSVPWRRTLSISRDSGEAVVFNDSTRLYNSDSLFHGDKFIWEHLRDNNRILTAEMILRLNRIVYDQSGAVTVQGQSLAALFKRLGIENSMKRFAGKEISGVQIVRELVRFVGGKADTLISGVRPVPLRDSRYGTILEDMELTLLQQAHLFRALHGGRLFPNPQNGLSLFLESVELQGKTYNMAKLFPVKDSILYTDIHSFSAVHLALFDSSRLDRFDPLFDRDSSDTSAQWVKATRPINFLSRGYSDLRRPFTYDRLSPVGKVRWGVTNGVLKIRLPLPSDSLGRATDIIWSSVGEWRRGMVPSAGKNGRDLHRPLVTELLARFGNVKATENQERYFVQYRHYIDSLWQKESAAMMNQNDSMVRQSN